MAAETKNSWNKINQWAEELELLHNIIDKTGLEETVKWGGPVFTFNGKNIIGTGGFKNYFTIWFFNGVFLSDPKKVLVNAQEGVTKSLRQWRFTSKEELDEKLIIAYILEAIENEKSGKIVPPAQKSKNFEVPGILKSALEKAGIAASFSVFTPGKQYEFVEYIDAAKREETKLSRIEKILPMIREGIGLNDKYR
jgi:uncharacterized protein YdeI (YjbR/CyaY-like superfamily)